MSSTPPRTRTLADALHGASFRLLGPDTPAGEDGAFHVMRADGSVATLLEAPGYPFDPWVVHFGQGDTWMRLLLGPLLGLPRMGRLANAGILNAIVREMDPDHAFVNVGVWHGFSFLAAMAGNDDKVCVGVDDFSQFGGPRDAFLRRFLARRSPRHHFHNQDYEDFFAAGVDHPVGAYFYDGAHEYEHQYRGLMAAEPLYADGAVIVVDDVSWHTPREATLQFAEDSRLDWTLVLDQPTASESHPTLWNGVMVLQAGVGDTPPLRIPTVDQLRTAEDGDRFGRASLSVIVVGNGGWELTQPVDDIELVQAADASELPAAIDASRGSYVAIASGDADAPPAMLWESVAEHQTRQART